MRILMVAPGALYSTYDVYQYYRKALKGLGVDTKTFRYHNNYMYHSAAIGAIQALENPDDDPTVANRAMQLAAEDMVSRIVRSRPDIVLVISGIALPAVVWPWLKEMQAALKNPFRLALLFTECPYIDDWQLKILPYLDTAFVMDRASLPQFRAIQPNTHYLPHAYDPDIHRPFGVGPGFECDVFMCGTGFPERQALLEEVDWEGIDLRLYGQWDFVTPGSRLSPYVYNEFLPNDVTATWYNGAKINLNIFRTATWFAEKIGHIEEGIARSLGPRCFEVMACESSLFTNHRAELDDLFGPDCAVIFDGADDLQEKIAFFLKHPEARERVASNALAAVRPHTYTARAKEMLNHLTA